jgi:hypothetical protein
MLSSYEILGVPSNAPLDEIKEAYRRLSSKTHPDRNVGDKASESYAKLINEAYESCCKNYKSDNASKPRQPPRETPKPPFSAKAGASNPVKKKSSTSIGLIFWLCAVALGAILKNSDSTTNHPASSAGQFVQSPERPIVFVGFTLGQEKDDVLFRYGKPPHRLKNSWWQYDFLNCSAMIHFSKMETVDQIQGWSKEKYAADSALAVNKWKIFIGERIDAVINLLSPGLQDYTIQREDNGQTRTYTFNRWHVACRCSLGEVRSIWIYS